MEFIPSGLQLKLIVSLERFSCAQLKLIVRLERFSCIQLDYLLI